MLKLYSNYFILKLMIINFLTIVGASWVSCQQAPSMNTKANASVAGQDLNKLINDYVLSLNTESIVLVDSIECDQIGRNIDEYDKGKLKYLYSSIEDTSRSVKISGDLNGDAENDFLVDYSCENCWGGSGAGNYLSNCFFITSGKEGYKIDEEMTRNFKRKLIDQLTKDFGNTYFEKPERVRFINGIEFSKIENQTVFGNFRINTQLCESTLPCFEGSFEFCPQQGQLKILGRKIE